MKLGQQTVQKDPGGRVQRTCWSDLMLVPAGDQITALTLAGAYRPQPGRACDGLEPAIVRGCAAAAVRSFLARVTCALVHPAGTAKHDDDARLDDQHGAP